MNAARSTEPFRRGPRRRVLGLVTFFLGLLQIALNLWTIVKAGKRKLISKALVEKMDLAVTEVNGCEYCLYFHARSALREGINLSDLRDIHEYYLSGKSTNLDEKELVAMTFAMHYAESNGNYGSAELQRLLQVYGSEATKDILAEMTIIQFGNLLGNTVHNFRERIQGKLSWFSWSKSNPLSEATIFVLGGFIYASVWNKKFSYEKGLES